MNLQDDAFSKDESRFTASSILWLIVASMAIFLIWSYFAVLDEVAIGEGKVTPASKGQIIQSLEGGILSELVVHEGDVVENGQKLATLDPALSRSSVEEAAQKIIALQARAARLRAEIENKSDVTFPPELADEKAVIERERQLFRTDVQAFHENVSQLSRQLRLAQQEIDIAMPLLKTGATNEVEILRLKQKAAELSTKLAATKGQYSVALKSDYATTMADLGPLLKVREGRADQLRRTIITSPTRGIVKDVRVNTIGGVIGPGGELMEIVPLDDQLLVEARLSPRDIAFIHPDQAATVKITAFEPSIYGTLAATVQNISPDTIEDQVDKRLYYYRVYLLTKHAYLETKDGKRHAIMPGMVATAEIRTGQKTVLDYLIKPLNRAAEALRER
ncbi:MAG TPA: HlyD family efflux transporter periplasmic adaptor subunit [Nitrosomonas europaea]|uniref:Putative hemolysin-type secretion transmembrane protein n=1 Tax=Nitrosomonas europaea (strain ATCC 19718 / CIP 103999 / KCTC 2705 / NBRC 14298) TaxID=228410 RepID=Q82XU1_NITEU|nr:HlyD family efflux transporter periplasmic adaptor subunit [Nitrosomonas europaea]CAD84069.1 putative hemolysin-type secretion transmembrane protein [Nitrosomonas europaea ATCC 19718]SDW90284.1 membrane fusion protein, adhesin transport system [Nitrosomonas europaea]SET44209.1 membrane fusion protein, adhesin transport system [Nitrosomonas europaea]SKA02214.1 membrane fusion protein, adhesin transport system [Nitrosomonas europaea]HRO57316.1 HlyD family efflux transporter periplasmic adapto